MNTRRSVVLAFLVNIVLQALLPSAGSLPTAAQSSVQTPDGHPCYWWPIALHEDSVAGKLVGDPLPDIYNGTDAGNFGWLRWREETSAANEGYLVSSLYDARYSVHYDNPEDPNDHELNPGDWVWANTGLSNSTNARAALDWLKAGPIKLRVPVWDEAYGTGVNARYHIVGAALIEIIDYRLASQNSITAEYLGWDESCD